MNPLLQINTEEVQRFISERVSTNPKFQVVIFVSVDRYPEGLFATVWVGQEPDAEMRQYANALEDELARLGAPCTILVKGEQELFHGGEHELFTKKGKFFWRSYRIAPEGDEDWVFMFSVSSGDATHHFRMSLTRTLASMLRARNLLDDEIILKVYLEEVKLRLERGDLTPEESNALMLSSRDLARFAGH